MTRIRMDTAEATRVAEQCLNKADALLQQMEHLRTSLDSLSSSWSGRSYNRISPQFDTVVQQGTQIAEQLRALGEDLQRIATALEIADAGGTAAFLAPLLAGVKERFARWLPSPSPPSELPNAPKNAQELFHTLQSMKEPIGLYKIGDNEYVVLIQGTKTGGGGRNWASALQEALGISTPYERKVREMIRQNIPKGATVHLVGYSQGGYVANEIADNQGILHDYHVGSVTTYGSPAARRPTKGVTYHHYAGKWDIVPALDRGWVRGVTSLFSSPVPSFSTFVDGILSLHASSHLKAVSTGPALSVKSHTGYGEAPELAREGLPFHPQMWEVVGTADTQASGGLSRPWQERDLLGITSHLVTYTSYDTSFVDILPDSLYPTVDAARDKINDLIGQL